MLRMSYEMPPTWPAMAGNGPRLYNKNNKMNQYFTKKQKMNPDFTKKQKMNQDFTKI